MVSLPPARSRSIKSSLFPVIFTVLCVHGARRVTSPGETVSTQGLGTLCVAAGVPSGLHSFWTRFHRGPPKYDLPSYRRSDERRTPATGSRASCALECRGVSPSFAFHVWQVGGPLALLVSSRQASLITMSANSQVRASSSRGAATALGFCDRVVAAPCGLALLCWLAVDLRARRARALLGPEGLPARVEDARVLLPRGGTPSPCHVRELRRVRLGVAKAAPCVCVWPSLASHRALLWGESPLLLIMSCTPPRRFLLGRPLT